MAGNTNGERKECNLTRSPLPPDDFEDVDNADAIDFLQEALEIEI